MNLRRKTLTLDVGLVFSGFALGAISVRLYATMTVYAPMTASRPFGSETFRQTFISRMQSRLHLTDKQVAQLTAIMDETRSRFREAQEKMAPELGAIEQQESQKIREMLSPEQNAEFDKVVQAQKEKQRAEGSRR